MEPVSLTELARLASLMAAVYAAGAGLVLLLAPAEVWSWPHPVAAVGARAHAVLESGAVDALLVVAANALYDARRLAHTVREFGRDVAALLILLTTSPRGAMA
ncbi:hypothetical protein [Streptomyces sp. NPDC051016]|uniref:hypothetical protein n=1 Tax=Streptomyces sp. NPDC051016 TaxID=3365638 RepID=UPI003799131F